MFKYKEFTLMMIYTEHFRQKSHSETSFSRYVLLFIRTLFMLFLRSLLFRMIPFGAIIFSCGWTFLFCRFRFYFFPVARSSVQLIAIRMINFFKLYLFCFGLKFLFKVSNIPENPLNFEHFLSPPIDKQGYSDYKKADSDK